MNNINVNTPFNLTACLLVLMLLCFAPDVNTQAAVYNIDVPLSQMEQVRLALEKYELKIEYILGIQYDDTVNVVIAEDINSFNQALGSEFPDWGAAAAIKARKLIVIKSPLMFNTGKSLDELLGHELGHLMLDHAAGGRWLPRWFEEGFCQMISGEWRISQDILITRAVWGSGLVPLTALENVNRFGGAKASLAYSQSYLAVTSLVQEFSTQFISDFLRYYRESGNYYESFFNSTGYEYIEWIGLWEKQTSKRYRFILYIFDSQILFPLIAVLFIVLYLVKRYITGKKLKQWQKEERFKRDEQGFSAWD